MTGEQDGETDGQVRSDLSQLFQHALEMCVGFLGEAGTFAPFYLYVDADDKVHLGTEARSGDVDREGAGAEVLERSWTALRDRAQQKGIWMTCVCADLSAEEAEDGFDSEMVFQMEHRSAEPLEARVPYRVPDGGEPQLGQIQLLNTPAYVFGDPSPGPAGSNS